MDVSMSERNEPVSAEFPQTFEVLEMIFLHLPGELNGLKEVCQRFNQVITNSVPLLKRCQLQWKYSSEKHFRSTGRKFCNVFFYLCRKEDAPKVLKFVRHHQLTLSIIEFDDYDCKLTAKEFREFLSLIAGTIKDFSLLSPFESSAETLRLVLPKLESLSLRHEGVNFFGYTGTDPKLSMPKLRKFEYTDEYSPEFNEGFELHDKTPAPMIEFLRNYDRLEILKVEASLAKRLLVESTIAPFKFQLKELALKIYEVEEATAIDDDNMHQSMTPELQGFLASQQNSLTHLTIENAALRSSDFEAIFKLNLKHLEISCCWFDRDESGEEGENEDQNNETIEKFVYRRFEGGDSDETMEVRRGTIAFILGNCLRLRSVEFHYASLSLYCSIYLSKMKFLTNLTLEHCNNIFPLHFPSLKTITVLGIEECFLVALEEILHLIMLNPQLQKITVPSSLKDSVKFASLTQTLFVEYQYPRPRRVTLD